METIFEGTMRVKTITHNKNIMLDLETMGNGPDAAIIAIGAVGFDLEKGGPLFEQCIGLESAVESRGVIDAGTVLWWMQQDEAAREIFNRPTSDHLYALMSFNAWVRDNFDPETVRVWGNGIDFDNVVLASAYRRARLPLPWNFKNGRCFRTVKNLFPIEAPDIPELTKHNALDDALWQARYLMKICEAHGIQL